MGKRTKKIKKNKKTKINLDMWKMRDLTLFGRVLIVKSLGISQLIYSASNVDVPNYVISTAKKRLFSFLWKNKRDKIKRVGLYQIKTTTREGYECPIWNDYD